MATCVVPPVSEVLFSFVEVVHSVQVVVVGHFVVVSVLLVWMNGSWVVTVVCVESPVSPVFSFFCFVPVVEWGMSVEMSSLPNGVLLILLGRSFLRSGLLLDWLEVLLCRGVLLICLLTSHGGLSLCDERIVWVV